MRVFRGIAVALMAWAIACVGSDPDPVEPKTTNPDAGPLAVVDSGSAPPTVDSGNPNAWPAVGDLTQLHVFITHATFPGDMTLPGANDTCTRIGETIEKRGRYVAWLSTTSKPISVELASLPDGAKWRNLRGELIFAEPPGRGSLPIKPIAVDEADADVPATEKVWTGTFGTGAASGFDCLDWTSVQSDASAIYGTLQGPSSWTVNATTEPCSATHRIYCFQLPEPRLGE